ncbi:FecR domain-containing protein [Haloferula sp. A504]|uniref:FecR domain-containing protein n=1 Tax=Haloferula sp. A504 TaxID=3373601 RepID=UPI0031BC2B6A|nr:FecR domain-containing protein [Verrucomicrobiaceae bacterium E54]
MPMSPVQLETRIQELVEGALDEERWPELREELIRSEEARRIYCAHARMHAVLERRVRGLKAVLAHESLVPVEQFEQARNRKSFRHATLSAAAALVIAALVMWRVILPPAPAALAFEASPGSEFTLTHANVEAAPKGGELEIGSRLVLHQGVMDLTFASGVRSIVRAPADFTLTSGDRLQLEEGIAWFRVPEKAVGFRVTTSELQATDLGTEFGVISKPDEADQVHVFDGRVEVVTRGGSRTRQVLEADQARKTTVVGTLTGTKADPGRFLTELPSALPYLHWSFDEPNPEEWRVDGNLSSGENSRLTPGAHDGASTIESGPGRFNRALVSSDFDSFAASDRIGPDGRTPFTLAYWLKVEPRSESPLRLVVLGWGTRFEAPGGDLAFLTHLNPVEDGNAVGITLGDTWWQGITPIDDGEWHHHAVVHTGRHTASGDPEVICYLDGRREPLARHEDESSDRDPGEAHPVILDTTGPDAAPVTFFASGKWRGQANPHDSRISLDEVFLIEGALGPPQIQGLLQSNHYPNPSN